MSKKDIEDMLDYAEFFTTIAFNAKGIIHSMWHVVRRNGEHSITLMPEAPSKDIAADVMRQHLKDVDAVRYIWIAEAWTLQHAVDHDEAMKIWEKGVRNHPDSIEVVTFSCEDEECGQFFAYRQIMRPKGQKPYLGGMVRQHGVTQNEGRFVGMLPQRGTIQ
jgi:hypothetical protein